jgi:hypothetical protein
MTDITTIDEDKKKNKYNDNGGTTTCGTTHSEKLTFTIVNKLDFIIWS